ncbi:MAG TPA: amino acid adenylation domain-containing protein [Steroidobacteraceae bacterium]|nr:amino acid adenylation domain-containing protein [Steroidobacteraceae bacterium]
MSVLLHNQVTQSAHRRPEATALVWNGARMTYGELDGASSQLAQLLVDAGCRCGDRVGVLMTKRPQALLAMLGALKAGAVHVPLDPVDADARLAPMLAAADCRFILAAGHVGRLLEEALAAAQLPQPPLLGWLDSNAAGATALPLLFELSDLAAFPATPPILVREPELAQILFTAGTTAAPKAVMMTHAGVWEFVAWARAQFGIDGTDRISQHSPLRCDAALFDVFGALSAGAQLHLVPSELNLLPHRLTQFIREHRLTQWLSVPSVLTQWEKFDALRQNDFPSLRRLLFTGEAIPTPTLMYLMRRLPHVQFTNLYGTAETSIASGFHTLARPPRDEYEAVPLGAARAGQQLHLLDEHLAPVADGDIGNLYIGGGGLSPGYWRDARSSLATFVEIAPGQGRVERLCRTGDRARRGADGQYYFCGRSEATIRTKGQLIDPAMIERVLHTLPELLDAAIVGIPSSGFGGAMLCCAYVPSPGAEPRLEYLRAALAERVPTHMLPVGWMRYEKLPRTPGGKLDRALLAERFRRSGSASPMPERWAAPAMASRATG